MLKLKTSAKFFAITRARITKFRDNETSRRELASCFRARSLKMLLWFLLVATILDRARINAAALRHAQLT